MRFTPLQAACSICTSGRKMLNLYHLKYDLHVTMPTEVFLLHLLLGFGHKVIAYARHKFWKKN